MFCSVLFPHKHADITHIVPWPVSYNMLWRHLPWIVRYLLGYQIFIISYHYSTGIDTNYIKSSAVSGPIMCCIQAIICGIIHHGFSLLCWTMMYAHISYRIYNVPYFVFRKYCIQTFQAISLTQALSQTNFSVNKQITKQVKFGVFRIFFLNAWGNGSKFDMLMNPYHLWNWLHGLLVFLILAPFWLSETGQMCSFQAFLWQCVGGMGQHLSCSCDIPRNEEGRL